MTDSTETQLPLWETTAVEGTFEEAIGALEQIVALLENGNLPLQVSLDSFEVGGKLSVRCQRLLQDAELRIELVQASLSATSPPFVADDDVPF